LKTLLLKAAYLFKFSGRVYTSRPTPPSLWLAHILKAGPWVPHGDAVYRWMWECVRAWLNDAGRGATHKTLTYCIANLNRR